MQSILQKYESLSNYTGTDKNSIHSYGTLYESLFTPLKDTTKELLEIGIFSGASLVAWADFFSSAHITGIDINLKNVKYGQNNNRITMINIDGTHPDTPAKLNKTFDIIIDDGSHLVQHQVASLDIFAPYLNPNGIYVIEDIDGKTTNEIKPQLEAMAQKHNLSFEWHDLRHIKNRYDDIVAVFRKK